VREATSSAPRCWWRSTFPVTVREAASVLGHRLDDIEADQPGLDWEPLLYALQVLEREIAGIGRS
jgi:hypothetical protein